MTFDRLRLALLGDAPPARRQALQGRVLPLLLRQAWTLHHYRQRFATAGLDRESGGPGLERLPITRRSDLQPLSASELLAPGVDPGTLVQHRTSGSTGQPLTVRRTWFEERLHGLARARALARHCPPWARAAVVVSRRPDDPRNRTRMVRSLERLGLQRRTVVECTEAPERIAEQIAASRPEVVVGLPGVLDRVAREAGSQLRGRLELRGVLTGGEVLTPEMRASIGGAFGASVHDTYASYEFGLLAAECPAGAYHVQPTVLLEVLRDGRPVAPGERGEAVVTDLLSFAMPLVRLHLGDVVTQGGPTCRCGARVPSIHAIQGRMIDYFPLPDGRLLHPYEIIRGLLREAPWVRQYRLVQERRDRVVLHAVAWRPPSPAELDAVGAAGREALGPAVEFSVALDAEIRPEPGGKLRPSRSLVASAYDGLDWDRII